MLKLSTKGQYGTRLMLELAIGYGKGPIPLNQIARKQGLSIKYLGNLITILKKEKLATANRGALGGYELAKAPADITLADVVQAVEGPLAVSECINSDKCKRLQFCVVRNIWKDVSDKLTSILNNVNLQDIVDMETKRQNQTMMYSI
jgi:Rrf2 family protein